MTPPVLPDSVVREIAKVEGTIYRGRVLYPFASAEDQAVYLERPPFGYLKSVYTVKQRPFPERSECFVMWVPWVCYEGIADLDSCTRITEDDRAEYVNKGTGYWYAGVYHEWPKRAEVAA